MTKAVSIIRLRSFSCYAMSLLVVYTNTSLVVQLGAIYTIYTIYIYYIYTIYIYREREREREGEREREDLTVMLAYYSIY